MDSLSVSMLDRALTAMSDAELAEFAGKIGALTAGQYRLDGNSQLALLGALHAVTVLAEEEKDHRRRGIEAARIAIDGVDVGELWDGSPPSLH